MRQMKSKAASESAVEMNNIVLPSHANALGTIFGGVLMSWIDIAAAICAQRHSRRIAVTASVDTLSFLVPIHIGDTVTLLARVVYTGKTSMVVAVDAYAENPLTGERKRCVTAHLSFVALDQKKKPTAIPQLLVKSKKEKLEYKAAAERRAFMIAQKKVLEQSSNKSQ